MIYLKLSPHEIFEEEEELVLSIEGLNVNISCTDGGKVLLQGEIGCSRKKKHEAFSILAPSTEDKKCADFFPFQKRKDQQPLSKRVREWVEVENCSGKMKDERWNLEWEGSAEDWRRPQSGKKGKADRLSKVSMVVDWGINNTTRFSLSNPTNVH